MEIDALVGRAAGYLYPSLDGTHIGLEVKPATTTELRSSLSLRLRGRSRCVEA
jgi:hypothetical protein